MGKRGQVTLFIIVGMVLLIMVVLLVIFFDVTSPEIYVHNPDFVRVEEYMDSLLSTHSYNALELAGERGGYIQNIEMVGFPYKHEFMGVETATAILKIPENRYGTTTKGGFRLPPPPPEEPWTELYTPGGASYTDEYKMGMSYLLELDETTHAGATTVKQELINYIETGIEGAYINDAFPEFDISTASKANVSVYFFDEITTFKLDYQVNITHVGIESKQVMREFETDIPIAFYDFYSFIQSAVDSDLRSLRYRMYDNGLYSQLPNHPNNPSSDNNIDKDFIVQSTEVDGDFELVTFIYNRTNEPEYRFQVMRQEIIPSDLDDLIDD